MRAPVLLLLLCLVPAIADALPRIDPAGSLEVLVADQAGRDALRYSIDGAAPGKPGEIPAVPSEPGQHWLVVHAGDGMPQRWVRFTVDPGWIPHFRDETGTTRVWYRYPENHVDSRIRIVALPTPTAATETRP